MSKRDSRKSSIMQRPTTNNLEAWKTYWEEQGQSWRIEPEVDTNRQIYLSERNLITPNVLQGVYPFKGIKLSRADVEWLLATHEDDHGPVIWSDESQRQRKGLDLRGADLRQMNLSGLPLAYMYGGLDLDTWSRATQEQCEAAAIHMEGANLKGADLRGAHMERADLGAAHMEGADLILAHMEGANLYEVYLEEAYLARAYMYGATLARAHMEGTNLRGAHMERANLRGAHMERADLGAAHMEGANLCNAFFDSGTQLDNINLGNEQFGVVSLADIHWSDVNVAVVNWASVRELGDEIEAHQQRTDYGTSVRANRQLAVVLKTQGLNEDASRFAYRADWLQRKVLWRQREFGRYCFSWFLDVLAGYGFMPERSFIAYLLVIAGFTTIYYLLGLTVGPYLSPVGAFVLSMTSFHGRGFFPGGIKLDDPLIVLAAFEAFVGLIIEVSLIATFTQRFFGK